jgi:hypothetical protein
MILPRQRRHGKEQKDLIRNNTSDIHILSCKLAIVDGQDLHFWMKFKVGK